jgi:hypothetical protein
MYSTAEAAIATEACNLVIKYGFNYLLITKITARILTSNWASYTSLKTLISPMKDAPESCFP